MSQKPIDLLPESIRASCMAGIRTGRMIALIGVAIAVIVAAATHTRFDLDRAQERLRRAEEHANLVLATEAKAREINAALARVRAQIDTHDRIVLPLEISSVLATLVNQLPGSVSLDRVDLDAHSRRVSGASGGARSQGTQEPAAAPPPRVLTGELTGFAASDDDIAELVSRLDTTPPFDGVSLDFSRTRSVRGHPAREFRISFRVSLDARYEEDRTTSQPVSDATVDESTQHPALAHVR